MPPPEVLRRPLARFAATRAGSRVYRAVLPALDRLVGAIREGRTFTDWILPTLLITTTGRRSGQARTHPLCYQRVPTGHAVVGTNWGQASHPAWTHNLLADPHAVIEVEGERRDVVARLTEGDEREDIYAMFERLSPNYAEYRRWTGDREIRVFVLEPA